MLRVKKTLIAAQLLPTLALLLMAGASRPPAAAGTERVLYTFHGGVDGVGPFAGVIADAAGNLYGTTSAGGGTGTGCGGTGCGTVFQLFPPTTVGAAWTETVLYSFQGFTAADGAVAESPLGFDYGGNLYGATRPPAVPRPTRTFSH